MSQVATIYGSLAAELGPVWEASYNLTHMGGLTLVVLHGEYCFCSYYVLDPYALSCLFKHCKSSLDSLCSSQTWTVCFQASLS